MIIIEKDFKIEYNGDCFILYFLRSKKEKKEEPKEEFKVHGYYSFIKNAFLAIYNWRNEKKYPFKESAADFRLKLVRFKKINDALDSYTTSIYLPIKDFEQAISNEFHYVKPKVKKKRKKKNEKKIEDSSN